ncbi:hypothetical protein BH18ACI4_BH18ACI4_21310 [soil metagenome]
MAAMLSVLLLTGGPVHAGPVVISEVLQVMGSYQNPSELQLRSLTQTASTSVSRVVTSGVKQNAGGPGTIADGTVATSGNSLLAGLSINSNTAQRGVEILDQGEVDGTICDCGDILIPLGGFPKLPLLFLAVIPFFFIDTGGDIDTPIFTLTPPLNPTPLLSPTPTPPLTPIPEPASLLLFGSGIAAFGAGLRRRYAKAKLGKRDDATREAE